MLYPFYVIIGQSDCHELVFEIVVRVGKLNEEQSKVGEVACMQQWSPC